MAWWQFHDSDKSLLEEMLIFSNKSEKEKK